ncbi:hypothetical protein BH10CYA1_BH10CYA1_59330 [soil metagenome]
MRKLAQLLLSTVLLSVTAASSQETAHGGSNRNLSTAPPHAPIVYPFACSPGSATYVSGHGHPGLVLSNADHSYQCNFQNGTAGCTVLFGHNGDSVPFQNLSFTLSGGTNGTVNIYVDSKEIAVATYSLPFTSLESTSIKLLPSQFNPPFKPGTGVFQLTFDANPCQQVTIKNVAVNGVSASINLNPPNCICVGSPPN